jgi:hypothetical protein
MITSATLPKTFNNLFGFERGLCQRQSRQFAYVPKTSVFERASSIRVVQKVPSQSAGCRQQFKTATIIKMKDALK